VGDYTPGKTVYVDFNTHQTTGTPITLAGTPAVSVYKRGSTTESTAGVTLSVDYDSRTGYHLVTVDTSADGTFYSAGSDYSVVITTGTVDGTSVVGTTVGFFSLSNRSALRPATADRTLVVDAGGRASADLTAILGDTGFPTSLTSFLEEGYDPGTTTVRANVARISDDATAADNCEAFFDGTGYAGTGNVIPTVTNLTNLPAITSNWLTAAGLATDAVAEIQNGLSTLDAAGVRTAVGLAFANLDTQLTAIKTKTDNLPTDPADASDIAAAFSTVNATLATIAAYIDTEVAAIKAKTDNLPTDPADASDIAASFSSLASTLSTIAGYIDTEVAAIKAKTDQLAFTTANRVDCQVLGLENNTITAAVLATDAGSEIATAVTAKDLGNGRTVAYYLKGGTNKIAFAADGLTFTVYDTDDLTTLYTGTSPRFSTAVRGLQQIDPS
jgi:ActR/RegA family two-component response regulator